MNLDSKEFENLKNKAYTNKWGKENWSDWGLLFRFLIVICHLLVSKGKGKQGKRKVSEWSKFLGEQMRAGKTIQEAAVLYRERKVHN